MNKTRFLYNVQLCSILLFFWRALQVLWKSLCIHYANVFIHSYLMNTDLTKNNSKNVIRNINKIIMITVNFKYRCLQSRITWINVERLSLYLKYTRKLFHFSCYSKNESTIRKALIYCNTIVLLKDLN